MQTNAIHTGGARAVTFVLAVLAALSASYWFLKSTQSNSVAIAAPATLASLEPLDTQLVARALGGGATVQPPAAGAGPGVAGRPPFVLVGVLAQGAHGGVALISVDGKPVKPFAVGASLDGNLVLQSVAGRKAVLATGLDGPAQITLELPALRK